MTPADALALAPFLVPALGAVVVLLLAGFVRAPGASVWTAAGALALGLASVPWAAASAPRDVTPLLRIDGWSLFFAALVLAAGLAAALLARGYLERRTERPHEFHLLLLLAALGAAVLPASVHAASAFVALELLSVSLFGLVGYARSDARSLEAGIKYVVLAGASAAVLLFGLALLYAATGTLALEGLAARVAEPRGSPLLGLGTALLVAGLAFKLALVPFHMWTPDVYQGALAPAGALVATASKAGAFGLLVRLLGTSDGPPEAVVAAVAGVAVLSMVLGNLLALLQTNVKRLLAYSSIAHLGYLLVPFLAVGERGAEAAAFYLVAYATTVLAAFGVVTVLSGPERDAERLEDYRGLLWRRPALAVVLGLALLSLAGLPVTAGFVAKVYVLGVGVAGAPWAPVVALVVTSVLGLFYYLRWVLVLTEPPTTPPEEPAEIPYGAAAVLAATGLALVVLGAYPAGLLRLLGGALRG